MSGVGAKDTFLGEKSCRGRGKEGKNGFFREYQYFGGDQRRGSSEGDRAWSQKERWPRRKGNQKLKVENLKKAPVVHDDKCHSSTKQDKGSNQAVCSYG